MNLLKVDVSLAHPSKSAMEVFPQEHLQGDLDFAQARFNATYEEFQIVHSGFDTTGKWSFTFIFQVPQDYKFSHHLMRVVSRTLYRERNWGIFSTVPNRLFTISSVEQIDSVKSIALNKPKQKVDITMARFTVEIFGDQAIIDAITKLVELR